jgi:AraC-like DNA-binding protein
VSYREFVPHAALRSHVDRLWASASSAPEGARPVLPDGCIDVLFDRLSGEVRVVGTMTRAQVLEPTDRSCLVAVRFRPGGALPFLRVPAEELTDRVVDARALGLRWATAEPLEAVSDPRDALDELEARLLTRLGAADAPHPIVAYATRALYSPDPPSIASLEASTGWSRQHLTRMFSRHVGVGPKVLARVARLQRAVVALQAPHREGLADLAADLGYFDQAHMALDFRSLAGVAPSAVRASRGSIFPIPSLLTEA